MAFSYKPYTPSQQVKNAEKERDKYKSGYKESSKITGLYNDWQNLKNNSPGEWTGGQYGEQLNNALNDILNRKKFTYDLNGDMLYQQYKDQYITQGKQAMMDTMGQAAALTGGYGNSYAQSVGQQTYQGYLQGLNDKIPELYNLALNAYNAEGDRLKDNYGILSDQYGREYGEFQDKLSQWNTDVDRAYNIYNNEAGIERTQWNTDRQYALDAYNSVYNQDYSLYSDSYNRAFQNYQQNVSEEQFNKNYNLQKQQVSASQRQARATEKAAENDYYEALYGVTQLVGGKDIDSYMKNYFTGNKLYLDPKFGTKYNKEKDRITKEVNSFLDKYDLTPQQIGEIYKAIGL